MVRFFTAAALLLSMTACSSVRTTDRGGKSYRYFGFVEVVVPKVERDVEAVRIQSFGVALEKGLSVGWRDREMVLVPLKTSEDGAQPDEATCAVVVIVRSNAEAQHARDTLKNLKGDNVCLASFH